MSESILRTLGRDEEATPDWRAAAPGVELRSLAAVALTVPILLAAGVYWLHQLPAGPPLRATDNVIEVQLIGSHAAAVERQETPRAERQPTPPPAEKSVEDRIPAIPETQSAAASVQPERTAPAPSAAVPASAPAQRTASDQRAVAFQRALQSHIARFRHYPDAGRREWAQGTVQLLFSMRRDGTVTNVSVASSSGYQSLDAAAIETIRKAQPLPRIPAELPEHLNILVPVAFDLPQ
jgi:periplasmic protein TonB